MYEEKDEDMYSGSITLNDFISNSTSLYSLKGGGGRRIIIYLVSYTSVPSYDMDITSDVFSLYVSNEDTLFEAMKDVDKTMGLKDIVHIDFIEITSKNIEDIVTQLDKSETSSLIRCLIESLEK